MADKKFVWSWKEKTFDNWWAVINVSIRKSDLDNCKLSDKWYYFLTVATKREPDQYGNTHMIYENEFTPKPKAETDAWKNELFG